jgi:hypothetical protein
VEKNANVFSHEQIVFCCVEGEELGFVCVCFLQSWEIVARSGAFDNDLTTNIFWSILHMDQ